MGSFSEDELQTGMEQCGLDWSSEEVEIVDSMNEGTMKFGEISPGVSEASRRESLTFSLEPQLLRAAPLQVVLSGWCKHWKGLRVEFGEELFELSQPVQSIDVFLSHDWETSRWMKLLVMLLVFNSPAAAAASLLASIAVGVGQASGVVPENLWFFPFPCYWVYLLVLCFWQRIRGLCRHRMVFMDKLCIHQTDDKMKEVGILGLGAFVQQSDKLLVLWSQRYFNRLWCAYEMGCFFSREEGQVEILPVKVAYILFLTAIFWHTLMSVFHISAVVFRAAEGDQETLTLVVSTAAILCPVTLVLLPLMNYLGMSIMRDVYQLPDQLNKFRLQDAECFCCTHRHRHPETGQELICDRELVYQTLTDLYSPSQRESGRIDPLEKFNRRVRERLGPKILRRVGVRFPLKYVLFLVTVSNLAALPRFITRVVEGSGHQMSWHRAIWSGLVFLQWFQRCLVMIFFLEISVRLWNFGKFRHCQVPWAIMLSPIQLVVVGCFWIGLELPYSMEESWVPVLVFLVALALCILLRFC